MSIRFRFSLAAIVTVSLLPITFFAACSNGNDPAPAPRPSLTRDALMDPETCRQCHADHVREWSGSMHAYAAEDPLFLAMNKRGQRETNGALGDFCVKCHAPMAVREGATKDGLNLGELPKKLKGVTCFFCHTIDAVEGTHNAAVRLSADPVMRGSFGAAVSNTAHASVYSPLHDRKKLESASLCGACHDITTPLNAPIERTFAEWQDSAFSDPVKGLSCGQCHMDQSKTVRPIAEVPGVFARFAHSHMFPAVDVSLTPGFPEMDSQRRAVQEQLDSTLQAALCVRTFGQIATIRVIVDNIAAGHAFPSGSAQDRRLWTEVVAYKAGQISYQSGVVPDGTGVIDTAKTDPDLWLIRDCMFDQNRKEVHMFWEAAGYETNQLPQSFPTSDPRSFRTHITQTFPNAAGQTTATPDRVTLRIRLQPMGLDVADDLIQSGDLDPSVRGAIPTYDLATTLEWTRDAATQKYFEDNTPVLCVTKGAMNLNADKTPTTKHTVCSP